MEPITEFEYGMFMQALCAIEHEAREVCRLAIEKKLPFQTELAPLERAIRTLDALPAIKRLMTHKPLTSEILK